MSDVGRRPRWGFRLLAALLVVLVVDALGWAVAVHALRSRLDLWSRSGRASGWQVGYATPREAGWPFGAALDLDRPHVVVRGGLAWSAATARIGSDLFDPWWISLASHGQQTLALPGLDLPPFRAAHIAIAVPWTAPTRMRLRASGVVLPDPTAPFGQVIQHAEVTARFGTAGRLDLTAGRLDWGPLHARLVIALHRDAAGLAAGSGTLDLLDPQKALDALAQDGTTPPFMVAALRAGLALVGRPVPHGAPGEMAVPLRVVAGEVAVGGIPLSALPRFRWPSPP